MHRIKHNKYCSGVYLFTRYNTIDSSAQHDRQSISSYIYSVLMCSLVHTIMGPRSPPWVSCQYAVQQFRSKHLDTAALGWGHQNKDLVVGAFRVPSRIDPEFQCEVHPQCIIHTIFPLQQGSA